MTAAVFVDSNVFLYAMDEGDKSRQEAARNWRSAPWTSRLGRLSFQVHGQFYVNAMRLRPSARDEERAEIVDLLAWNPVVADAALRSVDGSFKIAIGALLGLTDSRGREGGMVWIPADRGLRGRPELGQSRGGESISARA
jgi:hypothetical protein